MKEMLIMVAMSSLVLWATKKYIKEFCANYFWHNSGICFDFREGKI